MNVSSGLRATLRRALLEKLRELLAEIPWLSEVRFQVPKQGADRSPDAVVRLGGHLDGRVELHVEVKSNLRPSQFHALATRHGNRPVKARTIPVLAAPVVTQRLGDLCRQAGWSWYDLAGNCRMDVPGLLRIERTGRLPAYRRPRPRASLGSTAAARLMRVLLTPVHAGTRWRQRDLQRNTIWEPGKRRPVSLGLVNKVLRHLEEQDFVTSTDEGVRLKDPVGLLAAWSKAYRFHRYERLGYFTLLKGRALVEALGEVGRLSGNLAAYAAFSAAERQAPHVSQARTWVHVAAEHLDLLASRAEAKEVDSGENLVVLIPEDMGVFVSFTETEDILVGESRLHCTDPVQTYVDLMHCGGRGEEAAGALLEQRLLPAWKNAGVG